MNQKSKGIMAVVMFMVVGMQFVWSFPMTMNRVIPWIQVVRHAREYAPARFVVEKLYYHKSTLPKSPDSWEVVGKDQNSRPARIVYGRLYKTSIPVLNEKDLHQAFQVGEQIDVLINYSLDYEDPIRVINFRHDLPAESRGLLKRCLLYSYGNLVVTAALLIGWYWLRNKKKSRGELQPLSQQSSRSRPKLNAGKANGT